jgi:hypothetical protein
MVVASHPKARITLTDIQSLGSKETVASKKCMRDSSSFGSPTDFALSYVIERIVFWKLRLVSSEWKIEANLKM